MKVTEPLMREQLLKLHKTFFNYQMTSSEFIDRSNDYYGLLKNFDENILRKAVEDVKEENEKMPTPKALQFKCVQLASKVKNGSVTLQEEKKCKYLSDKNASESFEYEREICNSRAADFRLPNDDMVCPFHLYMTTQSDKFLFTIDNIFLSDKSKNLSYCESEVFKYKFFEVADDEEKEKMRNSLSESQLVILKGIESRRDLIRKMLNKGE